MLSKDKNDKLAKQIALVLDFLKINKNLTGKQIELESNLSQLSKAKNPEYRINNREKLLEHLLTFYNLELNLERNDISYRPETSNSTKYYIIYYYLKEKRTIKKGIMKVRNWKDAEAFFFNADYSITEITWKGKYSVIESNTFIELEKRGPNETDATPLKTLMCLYSGTEKINHPFLIGTYSAVRKNNIPTGGKVLLERIDSFDLALNYLKENINPLIINFLAETNIVGETVTPDRIEELPLTYITNKFIGDYKLYFPEFNGTINEGSVIIDASNVVKLSMQEKILEGKVNIMSLNTMRLELRIMDIGGRLLDIDSTILIHSFNRWFAGICLSFGVDGLPLSYPVLMLEKSNPMAMEKINQYFESYPQIFLYWRNIYEKFLLDQSE